MFVRSRVSVSKLQTSDKIYIAGHNGLVGSHLLEVLHNRGYKNIITRNRTELDLLNPHAVENFFKECKPDVVLLAAAKVGGIFANNNYPADFIYENLMIQNNVIWMSHKYNAHRLIFLGSSCIYPKFSVQPINESSLLSGSLEITNKSYALAKIAGLELVDSLRRQYKKDYFTVMPTNLYGPRDKFHPYNSHVVVSLINNFLNAKLKNKPQVTVWGTGKAKRDFLHVLDCAEAIIYLAENMESSFFSDNEMHNISHINIGSGREYSIEHLAQIISKTINYNGGIVYDQGKPDGTPRKLLDNSLIESIGWRPKIGLIDGIAKTVDWFLKNEVVS